jgi:hypothetical protein
MAKTSIEILKDLMDGKISDRTSKMSVYINENEPSESNCILLFYMPGSSFTSQTKAPYYTLEIQIAVRHGDYDTARTMAFTALEYINSNRHKSSGVYFIPSASVPRYLGEDKSVGGYIWGFEIMSKGAK